MPQTQLLSALTDAAVLTDPAGVVHGCSVLGDVDPAFVPVVLAARRQQLARRAQRLRGAGQ